MRFAAINTIGLTGAEVIAAELAHFPDLLILPGQNFIGFETRTYRPHDYAGWAPADIFASLAKHHYTRAGRCWAGLTKSMSPELLARYDGAAHEAAFVRLAPTASTTIDHFENFATSYAATMGAAHDDAAMFGFFGNNMVLNAGAYDDFLERSVILDYTSPIDFWLAALCKRAVWDALPAVRFWLVNNLVVRRWALQHPEFYLRVDAREYAADADAVRSKLATFLGLPVPSDVTPVDGFSAYSPAVIAATEEDATKVRVILDGWAEFELGMTFDDWADDFIASPGATQLLDRFVEFWNTSSHTNLDWPGPIADEIVETLVASRGVKNRPNLNRWFYHESYHLNSDDWKNPTGTLEHYLGFLEDEIVLPATATHARIVLCYIERVAEQTVKRGYSAMPIRTTSLYRRVIELSGNFGGWDLADKLAEVEKKIDEADAAIDTFR